jgi:thiosulfate dehydrogenase [quinone] large subunit
MAKRDKVIKYTNLQTFFLVSLRIIIGWYFLYEGLTKIVNPDWSSFGYLMDSKGWFSGMFHSIAGNPDIVVVIDWLNKWGLTMIGLGLMLGLLTRLALFAGFFLLMMYYLSHPPLAAVTYILPQEGSYLWVNKTLIEMVTMIVLILFPTSHIFGLDRFVLRSDKKSA